MKIALLTDGVYPHQLGGMQKHSWYIARHLTRAGAEVTVYHTAPTGQTPGFDHPRLKEKSIPWPVSDRFPGHYLRENRKYAKSIAVDILTDQAPYDLIYAQGFTGYELLKRKKNGVQMPPVAVNLHGLEMFQQGTGLRDAFEKLMLKPISRSIIRHADYVISLGGKLTKLLLDQGVHDEKIIEIPIGIEEHWYTDDFKPTEDDTRVFTFIGRFERRKGLDLLHAVINKMPAAIRERAKFIIIGPVPEQVRLKSAHVLYTGGIRNEEEIKQILANADVLISPSYAEGMPTVILEAMARGNSIICTDVGATSCLVNSGNGWLIRKGSTRELMGAIQEAIELPAVSLDERKLSSVSRAWQYNWTEVAKLTLEKLSDRLIQLPDKD